MGIAKSDARQDANEPIYAIMPFWLNPATLAFGWACIAFAAWLEPEARYFSTMRSPKYFDSDALLTALFMLGAFAIGSIIGTASSRKAPKASYKSEHVYAFLLHKSTIRFVVAVYAICITVYIIAFGQTFNLGTIERLLNPNRAYERLGIQVSGITTATQFGVFVVTYCSLIIFSGVQISRKLRRRFNFMILSLVTFSIYRALLWTERLSFIEIAVPILTVFMVYNFRSKAILNIAPAIAIVGAIAIFGTFEYFRSWSFYREEYSGIIEFSVTRFMSYYYSAFNNFGMAAKHIDPYWQPIWTLDFLYRLPIPGNPLLDIKSSANNEFFTRSLEMYAHKEFNLYGAIGFIFFDFSVSGGVFVLAIFGMISGRLYNAFRRMSVHGLISYPIWMVGLLDFGRILYWPSSRAFPIWVCVILLAMLHAKYVRGPR